MIENVKTAEPRSYKERFEFELTVGNNIICQRYFRIANFNPKSLQSYELTDAIRKSVSIINTDLKNKTQAYLEMYAPMVFNSISEMTEYFKNPHNVMRMTLGEGIVVKGNKVTDYVYTENGPKELGYKFDDGELTEISPEVSKVTYKFAFKVDGEERCAMIWDGYYPKFVRDKIDISNKRGRFDGDDVNRLHLSSICYIRWYRDVQIWFMELLRIFVRYVAIARRRFTPKTWMVYLRVGELVHVMIC